MTSSDLLFSAFDQVKADYLIYFGSNITQILTNLFLQHHVMLFEGSIIVLIQVSHQFNFISSNNFPLVLTTFTRT